MDQDSNDEMYDPDYGAESDDSYAEEDEEEQDKNKITKPNNQWVMSDAQNFASIPAFEKEHK